MAALCARSAVFLRAVGDGHDVDVAEFRPALPPVAVRQDEVPPDLAARLDLAPGGTAQWNSALKRVTRTPVSLGLTCSRKVENRPMSLRRCEVARHGAKFVETHPGLPGAGEPGGFLVDFFDGEFALEREQHAPFAFVEFDRLRPWSFRARASARSPGSMVLRRTWPTPSTKIPLAGISRKFSAPTCRREQFAVFLQRKPARDLQGRPEPVIGPGRGGRPWNAGRRGR